MATRQMDDVRALVAFGKAGMEALASRGLSYMALVGAVALSAYAVYSAAWQGAVVALIFAVCVFIPAVRAESGRSVEGEEHGPEK